jgi:hypothetical protein
MLVHAAWWLALLLLLVLSVPTSTCAEFHVVCSSGMGDQHMPAGLLSNDMAYQAVRTTCEGRMQQQDLTDMLCTMLLGCVVQDCYNRPIASAPGAWIDVMERTDINGTA